MYVKKAYVKNTVVFVFMLLQLTRVGKGQTVRPSKIALVCFIRRSDPVGVVIPVPRTGTN